MTDTTREAAELLELGVCARGHAIYEYRDVTTEGRCVRCVDDIRRERAAIYAELGRVADARGALGSRAARQAYRAAVEAEVEAANARQARRYGRGRV